MAEIYLAKLVGAQGFEKNLVVKKILPHWSADPEFVSMLVDEAKLVVQLTHPNIVQVYELGKEKDDYYIAMEYVDGIDLRELLKTSGRVPPELALAILVDSLAALAYAHGKQDAAGRPLGIIHRDISPQNILLSSDGVVKLTDFGIAKAAFRNQETVTGILKGKFAYMSPEQASGRPMDQRSDLFSSAIVLYELLTGERLFEGKGDLDTLERARRAEIAFSPEGDKILGGRLREILLKALSRRPEERYATALELREKLIQYAEGKKWSLRQEKLALYLKGVLEKRKRTTAATVSMMVEPKRAARRDGLRRPVWKWYAFGGTALLLVSLLVGRAIRVSSAPEAASVPETSSVPKVSPVPEAAVIPADKEPGGLGFVSVQVVPWGDVVIDGRGRLESPVRRAPLTVGNHQITVSYGPAGKSYSATVQVAPDRHIACFADFDQGKGLRCR